jgi:hypothetical protein
VPKSKPTIRELRVVLDTSVLHTQMPADLVNADTRKLIDEHASHADLRVVWHLPEVVVLKRHFQMKEKAASLVRDFQKMDALLDFKLDLTPEKIDQRIGQIIESQMATIGISKIVLKTDKTDWPSLIRKAALREPHLREIYA